MTGIISSLISFIIKIFKSLIPNADTQAAGFISALSDFKTMIKVLDLLIPVDTCIAILLLMMSSAILYFTIFVVNWIIKRIRGG